MAVYSIWGQAAPSPSPSFGSSGAATTYSTVFTLSQSGSLTGIWYYSGASDGPLPGACGVFDVATKTLVASNLSPSWSGAQGSGWVKCTFPGSLTLDTRANGYAVSVHVGNQQKGFNNITFPITNGIITAPTADTYGFTNAPFAGGPGTLTYPTTSGGGLNWFVDVEVTTVAASPSLFPPRIPVPRRYPARAVTRQVLGLANAHGPNGTVQPRAVIPVPRRRPARASWRGTVTSTVNAAASGPRGSVQPRATVPAPRRYPSRASWRGPAAVVTVNFQPPAGQQPHGFVSSRRPVGGLWGGLYTPQPNASGPAGTVQPRASVPVPRRAAARASWRGTTPVASNAPAAGPAGTVQPRATTGISRRAAARVTWHGGAVPGTRAVPATGGLVRRRSPARAVWRGTTVTTVNAAPSAPVNGTIQAHPVIARRTAARAVTRGTITSTVNAPPPAPSGTVQPKATVPVPRRVPERVIWRGSAVPGQQPQTATGGLVRRRTAARGLWHSAAGTLPPVVTPGTPATGGRVVTRRPPSRGQWAGTVTRTSNALPVAVPAPRQRLTVPRRTTARVLWRGVIAVTSNAPPAPQTVLFSVVTARQQWAVTAARQQWSVTSARNSSQ